ncbi:MAG: zinc ribbon domain-containing protein [Acidobacteriota bacterium]|nr:zinc ribbon domain-containing protein [Blastocatellia bacterium]MDW8413512.1 zinc ribbon domain-containing protein [Acidobacteriota bacterium]
MFCSKCGAKISENSKFCPNCGAELATAIAPMQPASIYPISIPYDSIQATSARNWLEKIVARIPGYKGYQDKETRRDVDKLHREHVAQILFSLKQNVNAIIRELSDTGRLFEVGPLDKILKKLDKLENKIRYASYGYKGFFDVIKIQEPQLEQLYQFDLAILNDVELLKSKIEMLARQASDKTTLKAASAEVDITIDQLDERFSKRFEAIENPAWFPY